MKNNNLRKSKSKVGKRALQASNKKEWLLAGIILTITFLIYKPVINADFVNWDDDVNIIQNNNIKNLSSENLKNIFTHSFIGGYTPLTTLSFAINYKFSELNPKPYHITNILLHLACTLLVFILLKQLGMNLFITFTVTLLFGIFPMRVESVAWITERKDVLYSFFFLLSAISYLQYMKDKKTVYYLLALLAFGCTTKFPN